MPLSHLASAGGRWLANRVLHRWLPLRPGETVVSVTFDDLIHTACDAGAAILERHGCTGTFYVAGSLSDGLEDGKPTHSERDLERLHAAGHELGCHTWSHRRMAGAGQPDWPRDLDQNRRFLQAVTGAAPAQFAYPFGVYDWGAKRLGLQRFASCRRTGGAPHRERADLGALNSHRLYGPGADDRAWRPLLDTVATGGWLIVNTHAVENDPGAYGCTPGVLDQFLADCRGRGYRLLNIADALAFWRAA